MCVIYSKKGSKENKNPVFLLNDNEISACFFSPGSVLWSLPWSGVWIEFFDDWRLLFHSVCSGAWTGHCWAEENVDDQHDKEQNPESDAQIEQPGWAHPKTVSANRLGIWKKIFVHYLTNGSQVLAKKESDLENSINLGGNA